MKNSILAKAVRKDSIEMQLSIIIVNYNVRHFLEQALLSVQHALQGLEAEVFVIDNNSVDGSVSLISEKFPWVKLIANKQNLGFSKANNIGIRQAKGKYILLLNPDTVVEEDTFLKIVSFMDRTPDAGALGVKMYNGEGVFLPESKRGLPTPWVAFYKIFGLSKIFPKSPRFGHYHLSYLDNNELHEVEVLSGAFMLLRKQVLDQIGLLDETFFMYGEDIDLSYRVNLAGYKNYYYPFTKIIHYKGESTKKGSLNYVLVFYNAMRIFAEKHFSKGSFSTYMLLIQIAIYFRAGISIIKRMLERLAFPFLEAISILFATLGIKFLWERNVKYPNLENSYSPLFDWVVAPGYALIFVIFLGLLGAYKRPYKIRSVFSGVFSGFITIATLSFIFKDVNFSRAIVMISSGATLMLALIARSLLNYRRTGNVFLDEKARKRVLIVGDIAENERVINLIDYQLFYNCEIVGVVLPNESGAEQKLGNVKLYLQNIPILGDASQLDEIARYYAIEEIIFCNKSISTQEIIDHMSRLAIRDKRPNLEFKIVPHSADYLIGPSVILNASALKPRLANLQQQEYRFQKYLFDVVVSVGLLLTYPITFWIYKSPLRAFRNLWFVAKGNYHLVGYIDGSSPDLPKLKDSLLNMQFLSNKRRKQNRVTTHEAFKLDQIYARRYSTMLDLEIVLSGFRNLGER